MFQREQYVNREAEIQVLCLRIRKCDELLRLLLDTKNIQNVDFQKLRSYHGLQTSGLSENFSFSLKASIFCDYYKYSGKYFIFINLSLVLSILSQFLSIYLDFTCCIELYEIKTILCYNFILFFFPFLLSSSYIPTFYIFQIHDVISCNCCTQYI